MKSFVNEITLSCVFICICLSEYRAKARMVSAEQKLYKDLMGSYEKSVRPVINASSTVVVGFKLMINQIVDLDEKTQVLTTNVFIDQVWLDENLHWKPEDYEDVNKIRIPAKEVWLPDTYIYNNADQGSTGFMKGTFVMVSHTGMVQWPVPVKLKSSCKVDITLFPFDDQICILQFGSWIYSSEWLAFENTNNNTDLNYYVNNSEWDLLDITLTTSEHNYTYEQNPHPDLIFILHIKRRFFYYIYNIVVPCIMLSVLTMFSFCLPATSGEKITLGLSVFLAFSMFMLMIAEQVPATSNSVPLIGIYLTTVMTMTSLSVILAVVMNNFFNRGVKTRVAPLWLKKLILKWLAWFLRMDKELVNIKLYSTRKWKIKSASSNSPRKWSSIKRQSVKERKQQRDRGRKDEMIAIQRISSYLSLQEDSKSTGEVSPALSIRANSSVPSRYSPDPSEYSSAKSGYSPVKMPAPENQLSTLAVETFYKRSPKRKKRYSSKDVADSKSNNDDETGETVWLREEFRTNENPSDMTEIHDDIWVLRPGLSKSSDPAYTSRKTVPSVRQTSNSHESDNGMCSLIDHFKSQQKRYSRERRGRGLPKITIDSSNAPEPGEDFKDVSEIKSVREEIVVEWQCIATVLDRLLFWVYFIGTITAYVVIFAVITGNNNMNVENHAPVGSFHKSSPPSLAIRK